MKIFKLCVLICLGILSLTGNASAADVRSLYGKWIQKLPNGTTSVTEFSPYSMAEYTVDAAGKPHGVTRQTVTYVDRGNMIGVDMVAPDHDLKLEILVENKDSNTIVLHISGFMPQASDQTLTRWNE